MDAVVLAPLVSKGTSVGSRHSLSPATIEVTTDRHSQEIMQLLGTRYEHR